MPSKRNKSIDVRLPDISKNAAGLVCNRTNEGGRGGAAAFEQGL